MSRSPITQITIEKPSLDLIKKYAISGPRYTSYPTALEFNEGFGAESWRQTIAAQQNNGSHYSVYVHVPFCQSGCWYCACNRMVPKDRELVRPYLNALKRELEMTAKLLPKSVKVEQFHIGGGSPNYLTPDELTFLYHDVKQCFPGLLPNSDVSIELDPRRTSLEHIQVLAKSGVTRISLGVQDFDPIVQQTINREQSFEQTVLMLTSAKAAGINESNIDLIYGLPNQNLSRFQKTLQLAVELKPSRIALYGYAHVTWLKNSQSSINEKMLPSPEERVALFLQSLEVLQANGYVFVGMDHFCLPEDRMYQALLNGQLNRNFMGYTTHKGAKLLGFGASSISVLPEAFAQNNREIEPYIKAIDADALPTQRGIGRSKDDLLRWEIIETLMCRGRVSIQKIEEQWQINFNTYFADALQKLTPLAEDGLVTVDKEHIAPTVKGALFLRHIAFPFDAYLAKHREKQKPSFSQTV